VNDEEEELMKSATKLFIKHVISRILSLLTARQLAFIEKASQLAQGKGIRTDTISQEVEFMVDLLNRVDNDSPVVFDVGANRGRYTKTLLDRIPNVTVHAFEPSSVSFAGLKSQFALDSRVTLLNKALGNSQKLQTLFANEPGSALSSLTQRRLDHFGISFEVREQVSVITLDDYCAQLGYFPDAMKLDVEGNEMEVLRGGQETLNQCQIIQFEFGGCNIDTRIFFQDFYYFFSEKGFRIARITRKELIPIDSYNEILETFSTTNYIAWKS
jgi:FkbM family methyltransferase